LTGSFDIPPIGSPTLFLSRWAVHALEAVIGRQCNAVLTAEFPGSADFVELSSR